MKTEKAKAHIIALVNSENHISVVNLKHREPAKT